MFPGDFSLISGWNGRKRVIEAVVLVVLTPENTLDLGAQTLKNVQNMENQFLEESFGCELALRSPQEAEILL